jgi:glutaredoxin
MKWCPAPTANRKPKSKECLIIMNTKRKIEVFSAGCSTCKETIELVNRIAGSSHEVVVHDMQKSDVASKAKNYGVRSVPAVVIDGKLASCCAGRGPEERVLREALR